MPNSSSPLKTIAAVGAIAATGYALFKIFTTPPLKQKLTAAFEDVCTHIDQQHGWSKLPTPVGLVLLIGIRNKLRATNLFDTESATPRALPTAPQPNVTTHRTADGTFNDLKCPFMGSANTRFGRNVALENVHQEPASTIMTPSPRVVSTELLTRKTFTPATTLNLLAAAWLQFQIRDWFSHGKSPKDNPWQLPLGPNDPGPRTP